MMLATVGKYGTATAGKKGIAITGFCGKAQTRKFGTTMIEYIDNGFRRMLVDHVGKDGVKPDTFYAAL